MGGTSAYTRPVGGAALLPILGAGVAIATLLGCYGIAVFVEGKTPWLLDITHYSKDVPASFLFRIGIIPSCALIAGSWILAGSWMQDLAAGGSFGCETGLQTSRRKKATVLGSVAACCLVISSSLEDGAQTQWTLHVIFATSFFILTMAAAAFTTLNLKDLSNTAGAAVDPKTLRIRETLVVMGISILIVDALAGTPLLKSFVPAWTGNLCEWLATIDIISFIGVFGFDWREAFQVATEFNEAVVRRRIAARVQ